MFEKILECSKFWIFMIVSFKFANPDSVGVKDETLL